ncbi:metal-sulfur cluster assembly factor [Guptibacillus algicola]|uniref:metal-sulfur cluster assembly factor n=1 Tax=Guptibacillus algicola TaxID=225844 RepID=UPI001CD4D113|nr:metal-sulfur cluster assembly factor [Alkalihalobacillus algicola]MCA0987786.1 metal-sulfur cluster assembly factor [Alkalihalobacillus algicola]
MAADQATKDKLMEALENVIDPELGIDIVNLGLVYEVDLDETGKAEVKMTLTAMGCPLAGTIVNDVKRCLSDVEEVNDAEVDIVWNPPWTKDKMSRYAKIALGIS